jgi:hypothetical protein
MFTIGINQTVGGSEGGEGEKGEKDSCICVFERKVRRRRIGMRKKLALDFIGGVYGGGLVDGVG